MGQAADNERVKLRATFYNNLAVASVVTGLVIPIFTVLYTEALQNMPLTQVVQHNMFWPVLIAIVTVLFFAFVMRAFADTLLLQIKD